MKTLRHHAIPALVVIAATAATVALLTGGSSLEAMSHEAPPFGSEADVAFATELWKAMDGYMDWPMGSDVYPGTSPHGKFLRVYYNLVHVDGKPYHLIVKDNYGGEGVTQDKVEADPDRWLAAVTIMLQREAGYDPETDDWFWVKYTPDGSIEKNPKGMALAGRVAKGMDKGCIACHANAKGDDFVFANDH